MCDSQTRSLINRGVNSILYELLIFFILNTRTRQLSLCGPGTNNNVLFLVDLNDSMVVNIFEKFNMNDNECVK